MADLKRGFMDVWEGTDSNPEHIAQFSAHLPGCSRSQPLRVRDELTLLDHWTGAFAIKSRTISCGECGGRVTNSFS